MLLSKLFLRLKSRLKLKKKIKVLKRFRKLRWSLIRSTRSIRNIKFRFSLYKLKKKNNLNINYNKIFVRVAKNNIFGSLLNKRNTTKQTLISTSAGQYKIKITRRRVRFNAKIFINSLLYKFYLPISSSDKKKLLFISFSGPRTLKKWFILRILKKLKQKKKTFLIEAKTKKCFNGCRVKKMKRKKRVKFRLFK